MGERATGVASRALSKMSAMSPKGGNEHNPTTLLEKRRSPESRRELSQPTFL
jgi:hypothetical protein